MLSEPRVLAAAKEFILEAADTPTEDAIQYATVDTQFARESWPNAGPIEQATRETLSPFNHVALGTGYPDMVVAGPPPTFLDPMWVPEDSHPVLAVEAKGETKNRTGEDVPADTAILQAHDRLAESNAALAAIPETATSRQVRQLARELDVGLVTVNDDDTALVEPPVPKGVSTDETAAAVRWQASAQRVAGQSFHYNHPKTYLGIPLAIRATAETREVFETKIAGAGFGSGKAGAKFLGLIETSPEGTLRLTTLGREVVRFAIRTHGSIAAALDEMADWGGRGNSQDLIDRHEGWGEFTRSILFQYPATGFVVETIEEATPATNDPADASVGPTLPELVQALYEKRPAYTVELFIRQESGARERILDQDETLSTAALASTDVYQSTTVYQYKMMLRHAGVLHPDVAAKSTDELNPSSNHWTLRTSIGI